MNKPPYFFLAFLFSAALGAQPQLVLEAIPPSFDFPVDIVSSGEDSARLFIVEQEGRVKLYNQVSKVVENPLFLDLSDEVDASQFESGLLGMAFHPDYPTTKYVYVSYTVTGRPLISRISRFDVNLNGSAAVPSTELVLLDYAQPSANHLAGDIAFGSDGYLYIPTGDSGGAGDPGDVAQDGSSLLGKILRIDVDRKDAGLNYGIPADNPFVGDANVRDEIWALGLRNPFRISFDPANGDMYVGDVGQAQREEIDREPASSPGGRNYGWDCREGDIDYSEVEDPSAASCATTMNFTDPLFSYNHSTLGINGGRGSVTGGYVYRGPARDLRGYYVFGDFVSGNIYLLDVDNGAASVIIEGNLVPSLQDGGVSTFGVGNRGELYVADYVGRIYRVTTQLALPVELTRWTARASGKEVVLEWETASEDAARDFLVERGRNGTDFELLKTVAARGTTREAQQYQLEDASAAPGLNYYRLRQRDLDGTVNDHGIRSVNFLGGAAERPRVAPNPTVGNFTVNLPKIEEESLVSVRLFDAGGRAVYERSYLLGAGRHRLEHQLPDLPAGLYRLRLIYGDQLHQEPLLVK